MAQIKSLTVSALPVIPAFLLAAQTGDIQAGSIAAGGSFIASKMNKWASEYEDKKKKGEVFGPNELDENGQDSFIGLLKYLNTELPDEERWKAIKALFFAGISKKIDDKERELAFLIMERCKKLTTEELLVIKASNKLIHNEAFQNVMNHDNYVRINIWANYVAKEIGHNQEGMVVTLAQRLRDSGLLFFTGNSPQIDKLNDMLRKSSGGLSDMGLKFCELVEKYG